MEKKHSRKLSDGKFSFVGYANELGVKNSGGRLGSKEGPERFLAYFNQLRGSWPLQELLSEQRILFSGGNLEEDYGHAVQETKAILNAMKGKRDVLLALGGGHDNAYPWIKSLRECHSKKIRIACINLDAHFDLRGWTPLMTSGSPFRRLIDEGIIEGKNLVEFGIQAHCNPPELWDFAKKEKVKIIRFETLRNGKAVSAFKRELKQLRTKCDLIALSVDLDALSFAYSPGVSAPQAEGFIASELFQMLELAGRDPKVRSLGIFELAPALDFQDLTARLAAQSAWHFLNAKLS